ncbi:phosphoribosylanthranilate isomerase [Paenibacillus sp. GCM10027626]|uniref:phosphoribosylanthranilate isomerase n=1 Tax=Paenibacillus sp. GCM10027626 TaxID=3273411 RepID=UPI003634D9F8
MSRERQVRLKICGLQDAETIRQLAGLPIDEIGFVFAASRRQVLPAQAAMLIDEVKRLTTPSGSSPRTVGVVVNMELAEIGQMLAEAPLDVVQLHGGETPELCRAIKAKHAVDVWKVFSVTAEEAECGKENLVAAGAGPERLAAYAGAVDAVLLDTAGGGTGKTFAWHVIDAYAIEARKMGIPLYVAGGLHPDNVAELLSDYRPDGVDVSSGVETEGNKDVAKIIRFTERVKGA